MAARQADRKEHEFTHTGEVCHRIWRSRFPSSIL
jgi:hypothetical protein